MTATPRTRARDEMPEALRRDVRLLGELLGRVLRADGGDALLADVEEVRRAVIDAGTADAADVAIDAAVGVVDRLSLEITGHPHLLAGRRVLGRAVQIRDPYVDALSLLQLRALAALREGTLDARARGRHERLLLLTAGGIAAGLQNTG